MKNLHQRIHQNRNGLRDQLETLQLGYIPECLGESPNFSDSDKSLVADFGENADEVELPNPQKCQPITFQLFIPKEEWSRMKPEKVVCKDGKIYERLRPWVWESVIIRQIAESKIKLKCPFGFHGNHVYKSLNKPYFAFQGRCRVCGTGIKGYCDRMYNFLSEEIKITINSYDTRNLNHGKAKTFLRSANREKAQCFLSAYFIFSNFAIAFASVYKEFELTRQQDVREFATRFMNHINDNFSPSQPSPLFKNYYIVSVDQYQCVECNEESYGREAMESILPLPLHSNDTQTLKNLITMMLISEIEKNCDICQISNSKQWQYITLIDLPQILILQLKRFNYNENIEDETKRATKNRNPVEIHESITFSV